MKRRKLEGIEYVVYAHKHPDQKHYMYIGMGTPGRMFATNRSVDHLIWLEDMLKTYNLQDLVVSLGVFKDKSEAKTAEIDLIHEHKPVLNKTGVKPSHFKGTTQSKETRKKRSESMKKYIKENGMHWQNVSTEGGY